MLKKIFWALLAVLAIAQFVQPSFKNPPVEPSQTLETVAAPPAEALSILKKACFDCHSNETTWPFYAKISPVSWWIAGHVNEGREHLNFSEFGKLAPADRSEALGEAAEAVRDGEMPMRSYTIAHPKAVLSASEKTVLLAWLEANGGEGGGESKSEGDDD